MLLTGYLSEWLLLFVIWCEVYLLCTIGGATIHQLQAQSGAHIELDRGPPQSENERVFIIRGVVLCHVQNLLKN